MNQLPSLPAPLAAPAPLYEPDPSLRDWVAVCWQRKGLVMGAGLLCAALAFAWAWSQTPIYPSTATVVIDLERPGSLNSENYSDPGNRSPEYFQTHFELMKSQEVLRQAADQLDLEQQPEYQPKPSWLGAWTQPLAKILPVTIGEPDQPLEPRVRQERLLRRFAEHVEITPVRGARLAHITVYSESAEFAALAANRLAHAYIDYHQRLLAHSKGHMAEWFTSHLDGLRLKVQQAQANLYAFRQEHGLLEGRDKQTAATQRMADLSSELVKAETKKSELASRMERIRALLPGAGRGTAMDLSRVDMSAEVLNAPLIQNLRLQEARVAGEVADLSEKYGERHPKLAQAQAELRELRGQIAREITKLLDSVSREYDVARSREAAIRMAGVEHNRERMSLGHLDIEQGILEREADSAQQLYDIFLKVAKESDLSRGMTASNVYIADHAMPALNSVKPKRKLITLLGLLAGLLSGTALAVWIEGRHPRIRGPQDIGQYLPGVRLLGVIPKLRSRAVTQLAAPSAHALKLPALESFRIIRSSLLLASPSALPGQVLITSPGENEGKTMLAVNLAIAYAQLENQRVLLVDADFRKPSAHPLFAGAASSSPSPGLAHVLNGEAAPETACRPTAFANLDVLSNGFNPSNATELFHAKRFGAFLRWCREQQYQVILDGPPALPVADALVVANQVDGILLVASAGITTMDACRLALHRLLSVGGHIVGLVLQKASASDMPHYYGVAPMRPALEPPLHSIRS